MYTEDLIALRLAKEGFGSLEEIDRLPSDRVMDAFHYSCYLADYSETMSEMNKEKS